MPKQIHYAIISNVNLGDFYGEATIQICPDDNQTWYVSVSPTREVEERESSRWLDRSDNPRQYKSADAAKSAVEAEWGKQLWSIKEKGSE